MSLERALVFELMEEGSNKKDVMDIVIRMQSPELNEKYGTELKLNPKRIKVALNQYEARKELEKRGEYKRGFKEEIKKLIEERKREIEDSYPNLLSVKIAKNWSFLLDFVFFSKNFLGFPCPNCKKNRATELYTKVKYLNGKGKIPTPQIEKKFLLTYCKKCGDISYYDQYKN